MKNYCYLLLIAFLAGCTASRNYHPAKKFGEEELKQDFTTFRNILEESHPSLYWYTSKDSMNLYFEQAAGKIRDSMHEYQFRNVLSYVVSKIRCGHTSIRPSKAASFYAERTRSYSFPLGIKAWEDTVVVTFNMNRKDSILKRGAILKSIENRPISQVVDSFFSHLSSDGYNTTHKYQVLSNGGTFRNLYGSLFGLRTKMKVGFTDLDGTDKTTTIEVYNPAADTPAVKIKAPRISKKERKQRALNATRNLVIDTASSMAVIEINSFSKNRKIRKFLRQSFRKIEQMQIQNLVVDLRGNGGGNVVLSNLLTRYIAREPFKIADSIYSIRNKSSYKKYFDNYLQTRLFHLFMTKKDGEGRFHFRHYEGKYFRPKKKNHFDGKVFILTGGNTFSAASLVTKTLKGQSNVLVVGEETGGGAYGNSAWLIPEVTLPNSKVRFRLPLFRLVVDRDEEKGRGVFPDIPALPTIEAIRRNEDFKIKRVKEIIAGKRQASVQ